MNEGQRWESNTQDHERFEKAIVELHTAIFGDDNGNVGMKKQLEAMYGVFVPVTMTGRAILKTIIVLGSIAAALTAILELTGLFKHPSR